MSILGLGFQKKVADFATKKNKPFVFPYSGKNIFDKNSIVLGKYINSGGGETSSGTWNHTENIYVIGGLNIKISHQIGGSASAGLAAYSAAGELIFFITNNDIDAANRVITLPANAEFIRLSIATSVNLDTLQVEYGNTSTSYEEYNPIPTLPNFKNPQKVEVISSDSTVYQKRISDFLSGNTKPFVFPYSGKNIFDKNSIVLGKYINNTGGETSSGTWNHSDYIFVLGGNKIKVSHLVGASSAAGIAICDSSKSLISFISNSDFEAAGRVLLLPANAEYIRLSIATSVNLDTLQVEYGDVSTAYEAYSPIPTLPSFKEPQKVEVIGASLDTYPTGTHAPVMLPHGKNLFNKNSAKDNFLINSSGNEYSSADWFCSDFMPVIRRASLKINKLVGVFSEGAGAAFYDKNKKYIPNSWVSVKSLFEINGYVLTSPDNAAFLRISEYGLAQKNTLQIEYGTVTTRYENYNPLPTLAVIPTVKLKDLVPFEKVVSTNGVDVFKDNSGTFHACLRNIYVRYNHPNFEIYRNGINSNPELVSFTSTNFPNLLSGSTVLRIFILPFTRNATTSYPGYDWRLNVVTSKGQIYHNFPSRDVSTDGVVQSDDYKKFDEGCIWELPERWAPVKTTVGDDATLIATGKYKYYPALAESDYIFYPAISQDNGYGNGGFPAVIEKTNQSNQTVKFARFYQPNRGAYDSVSLDYMGGLIINEKMSVIGTYRNNLTNNGSRICVFYTNDGGRNWFCRYEFGAAGQLINSSDAQLMAPVTNHIPHDLYVDLAAAGSDLFQVIKRSQYTPTADVKEPTNKFKYSSPVPVSSITAAANRITVATGSAHGLVSGDIILFEKQSGAASNEWDWLVNSGHNSNSAGDGLIFKVVVVNSTSFTLKQEIHNPHNNLACRHIHSLNKSPHGITIGCGEIYPEGWILLHNYFASDAFYRLLPWDTFNYIRLTSSNVAAQRPLGFLLKHDGAYLIGMDNESTNIGNIALPTGRTGDGIRKSSTGVYKGNIANVDDLGQAECILESNEVAYFFQEINGVIVFVGQLGELGISTDNGSKWFRWKLETTSALSRFAGAMSDKMFMINNHIFHLKG